jgi:hypothetical protein
MFGNPCDEASRFLNQPVYRKQLAIPIEKTGLFGANPLLGFVKVTLFFAISGPRRALPST